MFLQKLKMRIYRLKLKLIIKLKAFPHYLDREITTVLTLNLIPYYL